MLLASVPSGLHTLDHLDAMAVQASSGQPEAAVIADVAGTGGSPPQPPGQMAQPGAEVPWEPIGPGRPLNVVIERVYSGNYPDTLQWVPGAESGDILVTSAHKSFVETAGAPRAVHLLKNRPGRCQLLQPSATEQGSMLVYYSPAVVDESIRFTFEISVDRDFSSDIGNALSKAFTVAAALPVFVPAAPYLIAAATAIPIADKAVNLLARPHVYFAQTIEISLNRPGMQTYTPGALLIVPDGAESEFARHSLNAERIVQTPDGQAYSGGVPYIVISIDGSAHDELNSWSSLAASAAMVGRFFGGSETLTTGIGLLGDALSLSNDLYFRKKAADAQKSLAAATTDADKQKYQDELSAYKKNIQDGVLKDTLN